MEAGFKRVDEKTDAGFKRVDLKMDAGFKKAEENRESLARMIANGFEDVTTKMAPKKMSQDLNKARKTSSLEWIFWLHILKLNILSAG
jgi:hypothetical protein